jgi:hypothetical protein
MPHDWNRLSQVRETQKTVAQETVARDRRAVEQSHAQARHAQDQLAQQEAAMATLWQDAAAALDGGAFRIDMLRDTGAWSRTLSTRVVAAAQTVQQAQAVLAEHNGVLDASRRELRAAMGEVEKVKRMHAEVQKTARREQSLRLEDTLDEVAAQAWQRRRGHPPQRS